MKDEIWKDIEGIPENVRFILEDINSNILWNYITNLQKENEQLKKCNRENITFLNQDDIRDILIRKDNKIFELQQIIDKAIEYIKSSIENSKPDLYNDDLDDLHILLNLLQGKSDE